MENSGDTIGSDIRSALQSYCTILGEKAAAAKAYGQVKQGNLFRALLYSPVGDQIAGLKKWLSREHPEVAQEIGKRLFHMPAGLQTTKNASAGWKTSFATCPRISFGTGWA